MRRAGIYIRKSNEPGETNHSLEVQRQTCVEIAERAGYEVHDTYRQVVSGWDPKADRSEMRRLISDVQAGHVSVIVVVREDRLGRRLSETARLLEICREAGCLIHTSTGVLDPSNASQALLYNIVSAIAENESASISARVRATLDRLRGISLTHGTPPFGMAVSERDENKHLHLIPCPIEAPIVVRMAELVLRDRMMPGEVAAILNDEGAKTRTGKYWTYKAVQASLLNPSLAGFATELSPGATSRSPRNLRPIMVDGKPARIHEQVLPVDDWERIKRAIEPTTTRRRRTSRSPLLAGLVICATCGSTMHSGYSHGNGKVYRRFVCPGYAYPPEQRCRNSISTLPLEEYIDQFVRATLKDDTFRGALRTARNQIQDPAKLTRLHDALQDAEERVEALSDSLSKMTNARAIQTIAEQLEVATNQADQARQAIEHHYARAESSVSFEEVFQYYNSLESSRRRFAIDHVVEKIVIDPGERVFLPGVKGGATVDLGRVGIKRKGVKDLIREPRGTLAPLPQHAECYTCLELVSRVRFNEHRVECQSSDEVEESFSASQDSARAEAST